GPARADEAPQPVAHQRRAEQRTGERAGIVPVSESLRALLGVGVFLAGFVAAHFVEPVVPVVCRPLLYAVPVYLMFRVGPRVGGGTRSDRPADPARAVMLWGGGAVALGRIAAVVIMA